MNKLALLGVVAISALMVGCSSTQSRDCADKGDCKPALCADAANCDPANCDKAKCAGKAEACSSEAKACASEKKADCCGTCGGGEHSHDGTTHEH